MPSRWPSGCRTISGPFLPKAPSPLRSFRPITRIRAQAGAQAADLFQGRILSLVLASQLLLLGLVLAFTPGFVGLLAPGFAARPEAMRLATELTRITFPYLALITLVVLWTGVLNAEKRFAAGAAARFC